MCFAYRAFAARHAAQGLSKPHEGQARVTNVNESTEEDACEYGGSLLYESRDRRGGGWIGRNSITSSYIRK